MLLIIALLVFLPVTSFAGCVAFGGPQEGSACTSASSELAWHNPPAQPKLVKLPGRPGYDRLLADPALASGVSLTGSLEFEFRGTGAHLIEIFLTNPEKDRHPFRLESDGQLLDDRPKIAPGPGRLRPKRGGRRFTLLALVAGPKKLTLRMDAPEYVLSVMRWTPVEDFEDGLVPKWVERARFLQANILLEAQGESPTARRSYMQQLYERIYFSRRPELKREAVIGLTRAWYWLAAENHEPDDLLQTRLLFEEALRVAPDDKIVRQMVSASCLSQTIRVGRMPSGPFCETVKPVPWEMEVPAPPAGAPDWAVAQRRLARRMDAITRWWVEKRQAPNGELGGGWGDDVEILRHWGPQALGLGSEVAARGVRNVADGLWKSGTLLHGYDHGISDVEHSSEPTTDTQPLFSALFPEETMVRERLAETAGCAHHWIQKQLDGRLRFRSSWFNCREADTAPDRAVDVHLNTRAMGPALWHAYLSRDPKLIALITGWADAWIEAMRSTRHGKPAGIFPPVMRSADGAYLIRSDHWDKPDAEWDYFQWSGGSQEAIASLLLGVHELTGQARYLEAAGESFRVLENCQAQEALCQAIRDAPEAFYEWRRRTGDARYDPAFGHKPDPGDAEILRRMTELARDLERRLSVNFEMYTSEVIYTDRVYYSLPAEYRQWLFGGETPRGDRFPTFAVTWPAVEGEFARAVLEARPDSLRLRAFNFESRPVEAASRVWRLHAGQYTWESAEAGGRRLVGGRFSVSRLPQLVRLPLPPRKEVTIRIRRQS